MSSREEAQAEAEAAFIRCGLPEKTAKQVQIAFRSLLDCMHTLQTDAEADCWTCLIQCRLLETLRKD